MSVPQQGVMWSELKRRQQLHTGKEWTWGEGINVCVGLFVFIMGVVVFSAENVCEG